MVNPQTTPEEERAWRIVEELKEENRTLKQENERLRQLLVVKALSAVGNKGAKRK